MVALAECGVNMDHPHTSRRKPTRIRKIVGERWVWKEHKDKAHRYWDEAFQQYGLSGMPCVVESVVLYQYQGAFI